MVLVRVGLAEVEEDKRSTILISRVIKPYAQLFATSNKQGAIMKIKAGAIVGILVLSGPLPLFAASAAGPYDPAIPRFRQAGDHEVNTAMIIENSKIVTSSLKVPILQEESRPEKRSTPSAVPQQTLCGLKGVMVFIEE